MKNHDDPYKIKLVLYILSNIANNHHCGPHFFSKIEKILNLIKEDMANYFSNLELFKIFRNNKHLLLFLSESKIITIDEIIVKNNFIT